MSDQLQNVTSYPQKQEAHNLEDKGFDEEEKEFTPPAVLQIKLQKSEESKKQNSLQRIDSNTGLPILSAKSYLSPLMTPNLSSKSRKNENRIEAKQIDLFGKLKQNNQNGIQQKGISYSATKQNSGNLSGLNKIEAYSPLVSGPQAKLKPQPFSFKSNLNNHKSSAGIMQSPLLPPTRGLKYNKQFQSHMHDLKQDNSVLQDLDLIKEKKDHIKHQSSSVGKWKMGERKLTVQLEKIDMSSNDSNTLQSPTVLQVPQAEKPNIVAGRRRSRFYAKDARTEIDAKSFGIAAASTHGQIGSFSPVRQSLHRDKFSNMTYDHQHRGSYKASLHSQHSLRSQGMRQYMPQIYSPQPRRMIGQGPQLRQMNIKGITSTQLSPTRKDSLRKQREQLYGRPRPDRLNMQQIGRGNKPSVLSIQQLQSPMLSARSTPRSGICVPLSPMTVDGRAKHSKVMQKLIREQDTVKTKVKKERFRKKNTLLKNAGAFLKSNSKNNRSFQGIKYEDNTTNEKEDEEDVELEVFKQYLEANQQEPSWGVIQPDEMWKSMWDLFMLLCIVWQAIYIPFKLCFDQSLDHQHDSWSDFESAMDICFGFDILLNFNTGFYKNGVPILSRKLIILSYLKSWFILDLVSTVPYATVVDFLLSESDSSGNKKTNNSQATQLLRLIRILRFLRFLKLLRVLKLSNLKSKYEDLVYNDTVNVLSGIAKIFLIIIFFTHTFACLFWLVGYQSSSSYSISWVVKKGMIDQDVITQYLTSMYWAFTTLVSLGYGDISATNNSERLICMTSMIIFSWVYALTLSQISRIVSEYNQAAVQFRENMFYVQKWMKYHELSGDLRNQIRRFLEYQWDLREQMKIEEEDVMKLLNQDLREKIILYTNAKQLRNLNFFNQFSVDFMGDLAFRMGTQTYSVGEDIILEKEEGDRIFFITSGKVCVLHRKTHTYLDDLQADDYFGELGFFTEKPRTTSVKARDFTNTIYLDRNAYFQVAESDPKLLSMIGVYYKLQNALINNDYTYMNIRCFICRNSDHIAISCDQFKLQRGNLHKIFNRMYMTHNNPTQKRRSSSSVSSSILKVPRQLDHYNTSEQMEMREVELLVDRDEVKDAMKVNSLNSELKSSIDSEDYMKYLYEQVGYVEQKDSFATETSHSQSTHRNPNNDTPTQNKKVPALNGRQAPTPENLNKRFGKSSIRGSIRVGKDTTPTPSSQRSKREKRKTPISQFHREEFNSEWEKEEEIRESNDSKYSPQQIDRRVIGFPQFYKLVNLDNNKSIKKSQLDGIQPGQLQKNKNYSSSSDSSNEEEKFSSGSKVRQRESVSTPNESSEFQRSTFYHGHQQAHSSAKRNFSQGLSHYNQNSQERISDFVEANQSINSVSQNEEGMVDVEVEFNNDHEVGEQLRINGLTQDRAYEEDDYGINDIIMEASEQDEETPGAYKMFRFKNRLSQRMFSLNYGKSNSESIDDSNTYTTSAANKTDTSQPRNTFETIQKNSKKMSSNFLNLLKADDRRSKNQMGKARALNTILEIPVEVKRKSSNPYLMPQQFKFADEVSQLDASADKSVRSLRLNVANSYKDYGSQDFNQVQDRVESYQGMQTSSNGSPDHKSKASLALTLNPNQNKFVFNNQLTSNSGSGSNLPQRQSTMAMQFRNSLTRSSNDSVNLLQRSIPERQETLKLQPQQSIRREIILKNKSQESDQSMRQGTPEKKTNTQIQRQISNHVSIEKKVTQLSENSTKQLQQTQMHLEAYSPPKGQGFRKSQTRFSYGRSGSGGKVLQMIHEQEEEFDPIVEESSSVSNKSTIINRLSTAGAKMRPNNINTPSALNDVFKSQGYQNKSLATQKQKQHFEKSREQFNNVNEMLLSDGSSSSSSLNQHTERERLTNDYRENQAIEKQNSPVNSNHNQKQGSRVNISKLAEQQYLENNQLSSRAQKLKSKTLSSATEATEVTNSRTGVKDKSAGRNLQKSLFKNQEKSSRESGNSMLSMSFKSTQDRNNYFAKLEQEMVKELQEVFELETESFLINNEDEEADEFAEESKRRKNLKNGSESGSESDEERSEGDNYLKQMEVIINQIEQEEIDRIQREEKIEQEKLRQLIEKENRKRALISARKGASYQRKVNRNTELKEENKEEKGAETLFIEEIEKQNLQNTEQGNLMNKIEDIMSRFDRRAAKQITICVDSLESHDFNRLKLQSQPPRMTLPLQKSISQTSKFSYSKRKLDSFRAQSRVEITLESEVFEEEFEEDSDENRNQVFDTEVVYDNALESKLLKELDNQKTLSFNRSPTKSKRRF